MSDNDAVSAQSNEENSVLQNSADDKNESTSSVSSSSFNRASLIKECERKLEEFLSNPKNSKDVANKTYSRELIQLLRAVIKIFHTVPCPVSEKRLCELRIDRRTAPSPAKVRIKAEKLRDKKNSKSAGARRPYIPKKDDPKLKQKIVIPRLPFKDHPFLKPHQSSNPWKPRSSDAGVTRFTTEKKTEEITRDIRGILNKIIPSNYATLSTEIIRKQIWNDLNTLSAVVDLIFLKAIEEQIFVEVYANLCLDLFNAEEAVAEDQCRFLKALTEKCQSGLESVVDDYDASTFRIRLENDSYRCAFPKMKEKRDEKIFNKHWRSFGILRFIAALCKVPVFDFQTIQNCLNRLIKKSKESEDDFIQMIEFAVFFAGIVGPQVAEKNVQDQISIINRYITYLEKCKPFLSSRIKFCIMKLADLRDNKWKTNGDEQKWMDIIIRDFIFEKMQNDRGTFIFQRVKN